MKFFLGTKITFFEKCGKFVHFFYLGPIRTNEPQRAFNKQTLPQMNFWVYLDANKHFFTSNVDQVIQDSNEIILRDKNYVF